MIVGRAADFVLKDDPNVVAWFVSCVAKIYSGARHGAQQYDDGAEMENLLRQWTNIRARNITCFTPDGNNRMPGNFGGTCA